MQVTFLEAKVPLTKTYEQRPDGTYVGGSYPGVTNFTSHTEEVTDVQQFTKSLMTHSAAGHCLLTNSLTRQITNESRAKLSDKEELRKWLVLDIDGIEGITDPEHFLAKCLPKQFQDVSYIVQHSPSSGIKPGIRVHVFFMLYDEVDVGSVSAWLKYVNLETQLLSDQITLSNNSMALSLKLDWVANNNGRIIYITPPECNNFSDPVTERITYVKKKYDTVSFNFAAIGSSQMRAKYKAKLNELRAAAGLKVSRKDDFYVTRNDKEYVVDALVEQARITDPEADNDRFMRCNLDGGDSLAYYYHRDNPTYLYNFKGEPAVRMKLLDPEYYARVAKPDMEKLRAKDEKPFIFRDHETDRYFMGIRKENKVVVQPGEVGSLNKVEDYFAQFGNTSPPSPIPTWNRVFDPESDIQWNSADNLFNTWRPTEYQKNALYRSSPPTTIDRVVKHVLGDDKEAYDHFMNWLAYIYQTRRKSGTAWVMHGCPGTGKGVLFNNIIRPIFGHDYCQTKQIRDLRDSFNGWMENAMFVNIDEANAEDVGREAKELINALKQWITDPIMSVRHMRATAVNSKSFINFIFTTNDFGVLPIQDGDRRFNVAPRQEIPIALSEGDLETIRDELQDFAGYLSALKVSEHAAHTPLANEAKDQLKTAAESSIDTFFRAFTTGNLRYFIEGAAESSDQYEHVATFRQAVDQWIDDVKHERVSDVTESQLRAAHVVICREKGIKIGTFRSMCDKRGIRRHDIKGDHGRWFGWRKAWGVDQGMKRDLKMHLKSVTSASDIEAEIAREYNDEKPK
jgi:hypothetical protein